MLFIASSAASPPRRTWSRSAAPRPRPARVCPTGLREYTSFNVAKRLVEFEFSCSIPRAQLRPSYGAGFQGAPVSCDPTDGHPDPRDTGRHGGAPRADETPHVAYVQSGRLHVVMDDGSEDEFGANDIMMLPPGHDAWSVGEEACVCIGFSAGGE